MFSGIWDICSFLFALFGVSWVMPKSVQQIVNCCEGKFHRPSRAKIWKAVLLCIMDNLVNESRTFDSCHRLNF